MSTGTLLPLPWFYALDANGEIVPGALAYFDLAGTSTPATTYADVALLSANPNPVVCDAAGRLGPVYLAPGTSVKLTLRTPSGSLLREMDNIAAAASTATNPATGVNTANLRLTLTAGVPVTTADVLAATSVKVEPYLGNRIDLYDGSAWNQRVVTASSIPLPVAANTRYDIFAYDSAGVPSYETAVTTRTTDLPLQDGIRVKSGAVTRRYLGTVQTTAVAGQTEASIAKQYLFNEQNRVLRPLRRMETTATWTYTTATTRQANANTANQVECVVGSPDALLDLCLIGISSNSTGGILTQVTIGEDSTSAFSTDSVFFAVQVGAAAGINQVLHAYLKKLPAVGKRVYSWQEYSAATGTTTWGGLGYYTGLSGWVAG